jgi:hypothetical protein
MGSQVHRSGNAHLAKPAKDGRHRLWTAMKANDGDATGKR